MWLKILSVVAIFMVCDFYFYNAKIVATANEVGVLPPEAPQ
jgi:hypothetical protein